MVPSWLLFPDLIFFKNQALFNYRLSDLLVIIWSTLHDCLGILVTVPINSPL